MVVDHESKSIIGDGTIYTEDDIYTMPTLGKDGNLSNRKLLVGYKRQANNILPPRLCGNIYLLENHFNARE